MSEAFFERPILNSPYAVPGRHWELDEQGQPTQQILESRRTARSSRRSRSRRSGRARSRKKSSSSSTKARASPPRSSSTTRRRSSMRFAGTSTPGERCPTRALGGHAGDGTPAPALAASRVQRRPPVLLPGRGGRDAIWLTEVAPQSEGGKGMLEHLADANNDANPELIAPGAEARHGRRQDHRHGDDHRLADGQRRPPSAEQALHARLPGLHAWPHDQGSPAGAPAERSRQLLREPRTRSRRHAR